MVGIDPEGAITGTKVLTHGESAGISDPVVGDGSDHAKTARTARQIRELLEDSI